MYIYIYAFSLFLRRTGRGSTWLRHGFRSGDTVPSPRQIRRQHTWLWHAFHPYPHDCMYTQSVSKADQSQNAWLQHTISKAESKCMAAVYYFQSRPETKCMAAAYYFQARPETKRMAPTYFPSSSKGPDTVHLSRQRKALSQDQTHNPRSVQKEPTDAYEAKNSSVSHFSTTVHVQLCTTYSFHTKGGKSAVCCLTE